MVGVTRITVPRYTISRIKSTPPEMINLPKRNFAILTKKDMLPSLRKTPQMSHFKFFQEFHLVIEKIILGFDQEILLKIIQELMLSFANTFSTISEEIVYIV